MFKSEEEALRYVGEHRVEMVDLTFTDLVGRWHHATLPGKEFSEETFRSGVAFDTSSVPGFKLTSRGDMVLVPDPGMGRIDPFYGTRILAFICEIREVGTLTPFERDPRSVLRKAEEYLKSLKIAEGCKFSPEFEFYIFDAVRFGNAPNNAHYFIASLEGDWHLPDREYPENTFKIPHQAGYHAMPPLDRYYPLRIEMVKTMLDNGIEVKYHHHEVGAPGQMEIEVKFTEPLKTADKGMLVKYIARMVAMKHHKTVTFMPKPLYDAAGSGMHFHQFLHKDGKSLFYRKGGYSNLSQMGLNYIGGLLHHTPAVMGFTNPSTNSYKRLVPGFEAPTKIFFGLANRSAAIRIPKYDDNPYLKRVEFRPGDGMGNIYFAIAAQLLAGLDGIRKKIKPGNFNYGPIDEDIEKLTDEERVKIKLVPGGLEEALMALDYDREFLTSTGVFTDDLINSWIRYKFEMEYYQICDRPHPYEIELYYDL